MKYTFSQFKNQYPNDEACLDAIMHRRYSDKAACPGCGVIPTKFYRIEGRRALACQWCGHHVYPCVGTPFEHSSTPLTLWFHAMYLLTATRNGVSAKELQRQLGVTYKCAWRMGHELRMLMGGEKRTTPMGGHIEIDETYVGGKVKGKGNRYVKNKTVVMGILQRHGELRAHVVENDKKNTLLPHIVKHVAKGSTVSTDTLSAYKALSGLGYDHGAVNHSIEEWVRGIHHVNGVEGFWSHLKRGISSTHVHVSKKHMQKYVEEFGFRYNNRHDPAGMFNLLISSL